MKKKTKQNKALQATLYAIGGLLIGGLITFAVMNNAPEQENMETIAIAPISFEIPEDWHVYGSRDVEGGLSVNLEIRQDHRIEMFPSDWPLDPAILLSVNPREANLGMGGTLLLEDEVTVNDITVFRAIYEHGAENDNPFRIHIADFGDSQGNDYSLSYIEYLPPNNRDFSSHVEMMNQIIQSLTE